MIPYSQPQGKRFFRGFSSGGKCAILMLLPRRPAQREGEDVLRAIQKAARRAGARKARRLPAPGAVVLRQVPLQAGGAAAGSGRGCLRAAAGAFQRGAGDGSGHCHGAAGFARQHTGSGRGRRPWRGTALGHDDDPLRGLPLLKAHLHTARHDGGHRRLRPAARSTALTPTAARNWRCARSIRRFR